MNNDNKVTVSCASPLAIIVFLAFFFAKIFGKIDWSWWWVFSPIWIPFVFVILFFIIIGILKIWLWK